MTLTSNQHGLEFAIDRAMPVFIPPDMSCDITHSRCWPLRVSDDIGTWFARGRTPLVTPLSPNLSPAGSPAHSLQHRRAGTLARSREITDTHARTRARQFGSLRRPGLAKHCKAQSTHNAHVTRPHRKKRRSLPGHRHVRASCRPAGAFISAPSSRGKEGNSSRSS
jgi:hypothetical protein